MYQQVEFCLPVLLNFWAKEGRRFIALVLCVSDSSTYNPWKKDVDDMLHDLPIVEQISQLISQLRLPYNVSVAPTVGDTSVSRH